jgi:hypothetical protein
MGFRSLSADLDRLLDRFVAGEEPETTGDLAPLLHPAQVASVAFFRSLDPAVAEKHLAALRADRARNVMVLPPLRRPRLRLAVAGLIGAAFLVFGAGSAVAISSGAVPGDPLYGVKRAVERISLAMHRDPAGRASLHLKFAESRLQELAAMAAAGRDTTEVASDLDDELEDAEVEALHANGLGHHAEALLVRVQAMISKHVAILTDVLNKVPDKAKGAIRHAISNAEKARSKVQHGRSQGSDRGNSGGTGGNGKPASTPGKKGSPSGRP